MKKWIAVAILAVVGTLVVADLAKSDDSTSSTKTEAPSTTTTEAPSTTTTTEDNRKALTATCLSTGSELVDTASEYIHTLSDNVYVVVADVSVRYAAINTGEKLSSALRQWATTCEFLSSETASSARTLASSIDNIVVILRTGK